MVNQNHQCVNVPSLLCLIKTLPLNSPASPEHVSFKSVLNVRDAKGENRQETLQRRVIGAKFMKKKALPIHTRIGKNERKKGI